MDGDKDGAAVRSMTEVEDETAEMKIGSCGSREGGRSVWLGAGSENAEIVPELNLLKTVFISLALSLVIQGLLLESTSLFWWGRCCPHRSWSVYGQ